MGLREDVVVRLRRWLTEPIIELEDVVEVQAGFRMRWGDLPLVVRVEEEGRGSLRARVVVEAMLLKDVAVTDALRAWIVDHSGDVVMGRCVLAGDEESAVLTYRHSVPVRAMNPQDFDMVLDSVARVGLKNREDVHKQWGGTLIGESA